MSNSRNEQAFVLYNDLIQVLAMNFGPDGISIQDAINNRSIDLNTLLRLQTHFTNPTLDNTLKKDEPEDQKHNRQQALDNFAQYIRSQLSPKEFNHLTHELAEHESNKNDVNQLFRDQVSVIKAFMRVEINEFQNSNNTDELPPAFFSHLSVIKNKFKDKFPRDPDPQGNKPFNTLVQMMVLGKLPKQYSNRNYQADFNSFIRNHTPPLTTNGQLRGMMIEAINKEAKARRDFKSFYNRMDRYIQESSENNPKFPQSEFYQELVNFMKPYKAISMLPEIEAINVNDPVTQAELDLLVQITHDQVRASTFITAALAHEDFHNFLNNPKNPNAKFVSEFLLKNPDDMTYNSIAALDGMLMDAPRRNIQLQGQIASMLSDSNKSKNKNDAHFSDTTILTLNDALASITKQTEELELRLKQPYIDRFNQMKSEINDVLIKLASRNANNPVILEELLQIKTEISLISYDGSSYDATSSPNSLQKQAYLDLQLAIYKLESNPKLNDGAEKIHKILMNSEFYANINKQNRSELNSELEKLKPAALLQAKATRINASQEVHLNEIKSELDKTLQDALRRDIKQDNPDPGLLNKLSALRTIVANINPAENGASGKPAYDKLKTKLDQLPDSKVKSKLISQLNQSHFAADVGATVIHSPHLGLSGILSTIKPKARSILKGYPTGETKPPKPSR